MTDFLHRCTLYSSIQTEIENHGRVQFGKRVDGSWICNDCVTKRDDETTSIIQDDSISMHHENIGDASKSEVSPNTPPADEADV